MLTQSIGRFSERWIFQQNSILFWWDFHVAGEILISHVVLRLAFN